jgi:hypothetical protein
MRPFPKLAACEELRRRMGWTGKHYAPMVGGVFAGEQLKSRFLAQC